MASNPTLFCYDARKALTQKGLTMLSLRHYGSVKAGLLKESPWMKKFHVDWPESSMGPWRIERFTVKLDIEALRHYRDGRGMFPGKYTRLVHDTRGIVMSDTTAEMWDMFSFYSRARGRILIHGLGLGCIVKALLEKETVNHIDVVEIDKDIVSLVGRHFFGNPRVTIHCADVFTYKWPAKTKWDGVWHDIWDSICEDNQTGMTILRRKFAIRCCFQMCWGEE